MSDEGCMAWLTSLVFHQLVKAVTEEVEVCFVLYLHCLLGPIRCVHNTEQSARSRPVTGLSHDTGHCCLLSNTGGLIRHSALMGYLWRQENVHVLLAIGYGETYPIWTGPEVPLQKFALQFQQNKL